MAPVQAGKRSWNLVAVVLIAAIVALLVSGTWWFSDARRVEHTVASTPLETPDKALEVPASLAQVWHAPSAQTLTPIVTNGGVLTANNDRLAMLDLRTGKEAWSYDRGLPLCDVTSSRSNIVAVYRGPKGCGDVVSLQADTGEYAHTRSALSEDEATALRSNNASGIITDKHVELWRSDLVLTTHVGFQEAPVVNEKQPSAECAFRGALTRKEILATLQQCEGKGGLLLRLLKRSPERSDTPEALQEFRVPAGSRLVAIAEGAAAVYTPTGSGREGDGKTAPQLIVGTKEGKVRHYPMPQAEASEAGEPGVEQPMTADLPHNMTWWTGKGIVGFHPVTLAPEFTAPDAIGIGDGMAGQLMVPVSGGVQVYDPQNGPNRRKGALIRVLREHQNNPVHLRVQGDFLVEQRGGQLVVLTGTEAAPAD